MSKPVNVTDADFEKTVVEAELPVLVDFWAPWCGPCKTVAPSLEKLAAEYDGKIRVAKVNTDDNPRWAQQLGVQGIPTMVVFHDGREIGRLVGAYPLPQLRQAFDQVLEYVGQQAQTAKATNGDAAHAN
jgi:thioredoxin 1